MSLIILALNTHLENTPMLCKKKAIFGEIFYRLPVDNPDERCVKCKMSDICYFRDKDLYRVCCKINGPRFLSKSTAYVVI